MYCRSAKSVTSASKHTPLSIGRCIICDETTSQREMSHASCRTYNSVCSHQLLQLGTHTLAWTLCCKPNNIHKLQNVCLLYDTQFDELRAKKIKATISFITTNEFEEHAERGSRNYDIIIFACTINLFQQNNFTNAQMSSKKQRLNMYILFLDMTIKCLDLVNNNFERMQTMKNLL